MSLCNTCLDISSFCRISDAAARVGAGCDKEERDVRRAGKGLGSARGCAGIFSGVSVGRCLKRCGEGNDTGSAVGGEAGGTGS